MLVLGEKASDLEFARRMVEEALSGGKAFQYFRKLVELQGGDVKMVDNPELLPKAKWIETVLAGRSGHLAAINARMVGETAVDLGAGRLKKGDPIDHAVGIIIHHKVGEYVEKGEPLFTIHANDRGRLERAKERLIAAHEWSSEPCDDLPLFYDIITG
jgi:pyrimidine-nucleoside phosphorylase